MTSLVMPPAGNGAASRLDFDAGAVPGWSLRTDLRGFETAPSVLTALPPAKTLDQPSEHKLDSAAASADTPPPDADTLPEPASILVLAIGLAGLYSLRRPKPPGATSRFSSKPALSPEQVIRLS